MNIQHNTHNEKYRIDDKIFCRLTILDENI